MADIALSQGVRQNLLSMQSTVDLMGRTQNRLATGKKVNSALDNPTNFFVAAGLENRANDLSRLLDSMGLGIKSLEQADNGIKSIKKLIETAQGTARQALQDSGVAAPKLTSALNVGATTPLNTPAGGGFTAADKIKIEYGANAAMEFTIYATETKATLSGTLGTYTNASGGPEPFRFSVAGKSYEVSLANGETSSALAAKITALNIPGLTAANTGGNLVLTAAGDLKIDPTSDASLLAQLNYGTTTSTYQPLGTVGALVDAINQDSKLNPPGTSPRVTASIVDGQLVIESAGREALKVTTTNTTTPNNPLNNLLGPTTATSAVKSVTRANLASQFESLKSQIDQIIVDTGYNGVNLLRGDKLSVLFNESNTTFIDIQGVEMDSEGLGLAPTLNGTSDDTFGSWQSDAEIKASLDKLDAAMKFLRTKASDFGSNLTVLQTRQDFTKQSILTLNGGSDLLTLADTTEEGANLLALQTRQQLSTQALAMASQVDQAVLRLFG